MQWGHGNSLIATIKCYTITLIHTLHNTHTVTHCAGPAGHTSRKIKEVHSVLVYFPSRSYAEHIVAASGKSADISRDILSVMRDSKSEPKLRAPVCDGKAVNTG